MTSISVLKNRLKNRWSVLLKSSGISKFFKWKFYAIESPIATQVPINRHGKVSCVLEISVGGWDDLRPCVTHGLPLNIGSQFSAVTSKAASQSVALPPSCAKMLG